MRRLLGKCALGAAVVTAGISVMAGTASAHHPEIQATFVCDDTGGLTIEYTSTAWAGWGSDPTNDPSRENLHIDIAVNGSVVDSGAYVPPSYSFSGTVAAPAGLLAGDVVDVSAIAVADWGNGGEGGQVSTVWVTVPDLDCAPVDPALGRFTGGGFQVRIGEARVTRGLTIHCDLLLSNNLEVNWGGNKFHMTEHLTTVACTDDPAIIQAQPPAPLDTLVGVGTGRYNGIDGFTIEFTLVDGGEPGTVADQAALRIYQTSNPGNVVLDLPLQALSGGNLQAHYDQPHK